MKLFTLQTTEISFKWGKISRKGEKGKRKIRCGKDGKEIREKGGKKINMGKD
jgi:hypothetical protein